MTAGRNNKKPLSRASAYDLCLKCSHLFNVLDARGAISVTERVAVIARVRALAVGIAKAYVDQQRIDPAPEEPEPKRCRRRTEKPPGFCSAAVPAAVRWASRPPSRGQDALGTAGKPALSEAEGMPALRSK